MDEWPGYGAAAACLQPGRLAPSGDTRLPAAQWPLAQPHIVNIDTSVVYDNFLQSLPIQKRGQAAGNGRGPSERGSNGRRSKGYRRLWEQVKTVGRGDTLEGDGRSGNLPLGDMSVEDLVRAIRSVPQDTPPLMVPAIAAALHYIDSRALAATMKELAKTAHLSRAIEVFDFLRSLPLDHELTCLLDVYTYTTGISLMGQAQQLRRALELVAEARSRGIMCNVHTYSSLMNVCIKCDACDLALDVFKQMRAEGVRPNVVTYNTLVDVYGKTGQWEKAVRVLDEMQLEGLEPEVRTFNTAIIACNMCGQPQEALKVYEKLLAAGHAPIATTYTALISAYGKAGQVDRALEAFHTMVAARCERSVITYSSLISALEKAGRWEVALQMFERMVSEGIAPNTVTYNSLISVCKEGSQWEQAAKVFDAMRAQGCRPDVVTFTALISAYERAGQWRPALKAFEAMQQQGCKADALVHQAVIDLLWCSGVAWAQARALALHSAALRSWHFRFSVQMASADEEVTEYLFPGSSATVAMLAVHRWLSDLRRQLEVDGVVAGLSRERLQLSMMGRGRSQPGRGATHNGGDAPASGIVRSSSTGQPSAAAAAGATAVVAEMTAMLEGLKAPFTLVEAVGGAEGTWVAESAAIKAWLGAPELPFALNTLVLPAVVAGGGEMRKLCASTDLSSDAFLESQCCEAFQTVARFEASHPVDMTRLPVPYLEARAGHVHTLFTLTANLGMSDETAFDTVLLMDRAAAVGALSSAPAPDGDEAAAAAATPPTREGCTAFAAAALQVIALQGGSGGAVPTASQLEAAMGCAPGSVARATSNIATALDGDTTAIGALRCLKLMYERLGHTLGEGAPMAAVHAAAFAHLRACLLEPHLGALAPSTLAAGVLLCERREQGMLPAWPSTLASLTGLDAGGGALAAALAEVAPLAPLRGVGSGVAGEGVLSTPLVLHSAHHHHHHQHQHNHQHHHQQQHSHHINGRSAGGGDSSAGTPTHLSMAGGGAGSPGMRGMSAPGGPSLPPILTHRRVGALRRNGSHLGRMSAPGSGSGAHGGGDSLPSTPGSATCYGASPGGLGLNMAMRSASLGGHASGSLGSLSSLAAMATSGGHPSSPLAGLMQHSLQPQQQQQQQLAASFVEQAAAAAAAAAVGSPHTDHLTAALQELGLSGASAAAAAAAASAHLAHLGFPFGGLAAPPLHSSAMALQAAALGMQPSGGGMGLGVATSLALPQPLPQPQPHQQEAHHQQMPGGASDPALLGAFGTSQPLMGMPAFIPPGLGFGLSGGMGVSPAGSYSYYSTDLQGGLKL